MSEPQLLGSSSRALRRGLLCLSAASALLVGCAPAASQPIASPTPSATAEPTTPEVPRPGPRVPASCEELVPDAAALGLIPDAADSVVDINAARVVQAGISMCGWSGADARDLSMVLIPDYEMTSALDLPACQWYRASQVWYCDDEHVLGTVSMTISGRPGAATADQASADAWYAGVVAHASAAVTAAGVLPPWDGPEPTLAPDAFSSLDVATVAEIFGVQPSAYPSYQQEYISSEAYRLTGSSGYMWGENETGWATAELLPGGAWALEEIASAEPGPSQEAREYRPVVVEGLEDALLHAGDTWFEVCGARGEDLLCVMAAGPGGGEGGFLDAVERFLALLPAS